MTNERRQRDGPIDGTTTVAMSRLACTFEAGGVAGGATAEGDDPMEKLLDTLGKALVLDQEEEPNGSTEGEVTVSTE